MNVNDVLRTAARNVLAAVLLYAFIVVALAQQPPAAADAAPDADTDAAESAGEFAGLDRNRDGWLTVEEVGGSPSMVEGFATADRNGDGRIDRAEYESLRGYSMRNRSLILSPAPSGSGADASTPVFGSGR